MTRLLLLLLLVPTSVGAAELSAQEAAVLADGTVDEHCANVASRGVSDAATANTAVSDAWAKVSVAWEAHRAPYLLYWRGVLGACLGHEDRAVDDLKAYLGLVPDADDLGRDARRRLRRLESSEPMVSPPGLALVVGGGVGAAVGGALHAASFAQGGLSRAGEGWTSTLTEAGYASTLEVWDGPNKAGFGVLVGGAVAATAGVVALAVEGSRAPTVVLVPSRSGVTLAVGGRF